jgi:hypothetical protein
LFWKPPAYPAAGFTLPAGLATRGRNERCQHTTTDVSNLSGIAAGTPEKTPRKLTRIIPLAALAGRRPGLMEGQ